MIRILITGGTGFLGKKLTKQLKDLPDTKVVSVGSRDCDLLSIDATYQLVLSTSPNIIIHLAAKVGGIGANQASPTEFLRDNLTMGLNILNEAHHTPDLKQFLLIGSICSYPKFTPVPFMEENLWNGYPEETNAPYGIAKKTLIVLGKSMKTQYNFPFTCLMPVNMYGPGDNFNPDTSHVIPAMIKKIIEAKRLNEFSVTMWGTGNATREFLYVEDAAKGIASYLDVDWPDPVNLGTGKEISIKELAELIAEIVGFNGSIIWDTTKPDGQPRRCLDTSKLRTLTGFEAGTSLKEGLERTINWYKGTL